MSYLLLSGLRSERANALATHYLVTPPSILPALGFSHQLQRQLASDHGFEIAIRRVAMIYHDAELLGEGFGDGFYRFQPQQFRGATFISRHDHPSSSFSVSMQPSASCHLSFSLVLDINGAVDCQVVEECLRNGQFAGGRIVRYGSIQNDFDLSVLLKALPAGPSYWVVERQDLMQAYPDPLDALLHALAPLAPDDAKKADPLPVPEPWLTPAVLGYASLTDFEHRKGVRLLDDGTEPTHAFVETLVGLIQYISLRGYPKDKPFPFWRASWVRPDVYLAQQTLLSQENSQ